MPHCSVPGCPVYPKNSKRLGASLFRFPKNDNICQQWIRRIDCDELSDAYSHAELNSKRVCSLHFVKSDFSRGVRKKDAIPSVFPVVPDADSPIVVEVDTASVSFSQPQNLDTSLVSNITSPSISTAGVTSQSVTFSQQTTSEDDATAQLSDDSDDSASITANNLKYLVEHKDILQLLKHCKTCGISLSPDSITTSTKGPIITIKYLCSNHHEECWTNDGSKNLTTAISAAILYSGNSVQPISNFLNLLEVASISKTTFFRKQKELLIPIINEEYETQQNTILAELILRSFEQEKFTILGDGRSDSPGYSAKYTAYSLMEEESKKIIDLQLVQVTETTSSVAMEKEGFVRGLDFILSNGINVEVVATDRSPSIIKIMREEHGDIKHEFDVWHVCKGLKKRLSAAGLKKGNEELLLWIKSITNHLWYCSYMAKGDKILLHQMWRSILLHVQNIHEWNVGDTRMTCGHTVLQEAEKMRKRWINPDSAAFKALESIVMDKRLLSNLDHMALFKHTGILESFHSTLLKFSPKRIHYFYSSMRARNQLAILDHNENVGRKQKVTKDNEPKYSTKYSKLKKDWVLKKDYEEKSNDYARRLMDIALSAANKSRSFTASETPALPKNIAKVPKPSVEELLKRKNT